MIDFNNAVSTIRDNNGFIPNEHDDSFYRVYKTSKGVVQVRVSNHGTHLWTWVKNAPVNPSQCIANICIVLSEYGKHDSSVQVAVNKYRNNDNNPSGEPYDFEVIQYVYNCTMLSKKNAAIINKRVMEIPQKGTFIDPLKTDSDKHAGVFRLKPNQPIETLVNQCCIGVGPRQMIPQNIVGDDARPATRKTAGADSTIEESLGIYNKTKVNKTMNKKQTIRLNESQLKRIVSESVKRVLKEDDSFQSQERMYGIIANLEADIKTVLHNTDTTSAQAFGSPEEKLRAISNALSHIDNGLSQEAEQTFNKLLDVISELQDLRIQLKTFGAKDSYWGHNFKTPHGTVGLSNYN